MCARVRGTRVRGISTQADVPPPNPAGIDRAETTKVMTRYRPVRQLQVKSGTAQASAELDSASACSSALQQRPGREQLLRPLETDLGCAQRCPYFKTFNVSNVKNNPMQVDPQLGQPVGHHCRLSHNWVHCMSAAIYRHPLLHLHPGCPPSQNPSPTRYGFHEPTWKSDGQPPHRPGR